MRVMNEKKIKSCIMAVLLLIAGGKSCFSSQALPFDPVTPLLPSRDEAASESLALDEKPSWLIRMLPSARMNALRHRGEKSAAEKGIDSRDTYIRFPGEAITLFLSRNSPEELLEKIRRMTLQEDLTLDHLSREIDISFLDEGQEKIVFKVIFKPVSSSAQEPPCLILKILKDKDSSKFDAMISHQKKLNQQEYGLAPQLGDVFRTGEFTAYLEEFISGTTLKKLAREGELTREIRKKVIERAMQLYVAHGFLISDFRPKNLMYRTYPGGRGEIVIIDLDRQHLKTPSRILQVLHYWYGRDKKNILHRFFARDRQDDRFFLFDEMLRVLGGSLGTEFLKEALRELHHPVPHPVKTSLDAEMEKNRPEVMKTLGDFLKLIPARSAVD